MTTELQGSRAPLATLRRRQGAPTIFDPSSLALTLYASLALWVCYQLL